MEETVEFLSPPPDPVDLQQNLVGSSPNLPTPAPPTETLVDTGDYPSYSLGLEIESSEGEEPADNPSIPSPSKPSSSTLSESLANRSGLVSPVRVDEKPFMVGAGLANLGNTCFLNAVMQCFTHTVILVRGLRSCDHAMPCDRNSEGFCVLCAFREHIEASLASTGRVIYPWKFIDNLRYLSSSFQRYQQEDAHEFLQCFLDKLDTCCSDSQMKDMTLTVQDDSFVKQGFGGRLVSKLKCCNCGHFSDTYEPSIDLSLEIEDVNTLQTALESFTKVEKIEDPETKFTCENCKEQVSVEKQLLLEQAPSIATFHLKRFKNDGSYVEKIDKCLDFPLELDLQPYTSTSQDSTGELRYDLYAVVVHIGLSSTSGHYYCFIRSAPDTWYKFDDSKVVRVQEDYVLSQEAYILFYTKQGTPWFSSYYETLKPFLDSHISNTSPKSVLDKMDNFTSSPNCATNHNHDVKETSDSADEIFMESPIRTRPDRVDCSEEEDDAPSNSINGNCDIGMVSPPHVLQVKNLNQEEGKTNANNIEKVFSPSVLEKNLNSEEGKMNSNNTPQTPPRSPSPEIYKEETPEIGFSIKRNHLKMVRQLPSKKQLKKDWEGSETKEARRLLKSLPNARGRKLLAALEGSFSEGPQNKRIRRMELSR